MTWPHLLLIVGFVPLAVSAAPIPKESDASKLYRIYGTWSDPHNDSRIAVKGGELRVSLPAAERLLGREREGAKNNAPRALREVEGDFTAVVCVTFPIPERVPKGFWPYCSGGLVAWESNDAYLVIRRSGGMVNGHPEAIWSQLLTGTVSTVSELGPGKRAKSAFLRLKREGNKITAGWSRDGNEWMEIAPANVEWGARIKVGVVAENCLDMPVEITFDQYSLRQPKK